MSGPIHFSGAEERGIEVLLKDAISDAEVFVLELDGKLIAGHRTKFFENKSGASASFGKIMSHGWRFPVGIDLKELKRKLIASGRLKVRGIKI